MPSSQNDCRDKMIMKSSTSKNVSLYGLLTVAALLFGYVEYLVPLNFNAPGIKLGISNGVILFLIINKKYKAAILINIARILLSALLFVGPFSLLFSLIAGVVSTGIMIILNCFKGFGIVGISALGGTVHNLVQLLVAYFTVGAGVIFYLPFLLFAGILAGIIVGFLVWIMVNKFSKNKTSEGRE